MKRQDLALIILIAAAAGIFTFFMTEWIIPAPGANGKYESVPTAETITDNLTQPDEKNFPENAINPAQNIDTGNQDPNSPSFNAGN